MKFFFVMRHAMYMRNFESLIAELCGRGHHVTVGYMTAPEGVHDAQSRRMRQEVPGFDFIYAPTRAGIFLVFAKGIRSTRDYMRYLHPRYKHAQKLVARAGARLPWPFRAFLNLPFVDSEAFRSSLDALLRRLERMLPADKKVLSAIAETRPDILLVSPLVDLGSGELDYLKAAKTMGIPVGLCVASWDNLTTKGLIQMPPDFVCVWNEAMKSEAVELHRIEPVKVFVTGAPLYDHWFGKQPGYSREEFLGRVGLPPSRPVLAYLCSSGFIASEETEFVKRWIRALRSGGNEILSSASILIRPHPANAKQWQDAEFRDFENVAIWPRAGSHPIDDGSKNDYFDTIHHSEAVVGINTSAFIEAGIIGRPCLTILDPVFRLTQTGTLHFRHISEGGLLYVAAGFPEHMAQIGGLLSGKDPDVAKRRHFLESFIRPQGIGISSTVTYADVILEQSRRLLGLAPGAGLVSSNSGTGASPRVQGG